MATTSTGSAGAAQYDGVPVIAYTGKPLDGTFRTGQDAEPEVQCIATGSSDLLTWTKHP